MRRLGTRRSAPARGLGLLLALSLLLAGPSLAAQALGTIRGIVVDMNGKPVKGATVTSSREAATATTDASGLFSLKVKPGVHDVKATQKGFSPDTVKGVDVKAGGIKDISLLLLPGR